jgi:hypothetical protein
MATRLVMPASIAVPVRIAWRLRRLGDQLDG